MMMIYLAARTSGGLTLGVARQRGDLVEGEQETLLNRGFAHARTRTACGS